MKLSQEQQRLRGTIEELLDSQRDDLRLRDNLEGLRRDLNFPGLTWYWGPELYRRNRVVFRPFILSYFSEVGLGGTWGFRRIPWADHADRLVPWLAEARKNRDVALVRRLLRWKLASERWGMDNTAWCREVDQEYTTARGPAAQGLVLEEYEGPYQLDEPTALSLYATNRACSGFLLRHLPTRYSFWGGEKRDPWRRMIEESLKSGDDPLAFSLYRRQVDAKEWQRDVERLSDEVGDTDRLNDELRKRHPEGWGLKLGDGALALLKRRGRDVFPYIREKLETIVGGWSSSPPEPFIELARERGWWDLWAAVIRTASVPKHFNDAVGSLLDDRRLDDASRIERLKALAGVSREWNWPGFGLARVHTLQDEIAVRLYDRHPALVRGPFKPHIVPTWWQGGPGLLKAAQAAGDDELVDLLASRYVTRAIWKGFWNSGQEDKLLKVAEELAASFQDLRKRDQAAFARRAGNILTQVPAFAIYNYDQLLRSNPLARLFFVRSFSEFLADPGTVRDLVEGSEIHVQMLAYRILAQEDERARALAVESLDILLGTLLRPLHRKTRLAAFGALLNAAKSDAGSAARLLKGARDALKLPDTRYPKEELIGLIGRILHLRPELRGARERPVVYGLEEAAV